MNTSESTETNNLPTALFKKRGPKGKNLRKRPATPPPASDSDLDSGFESTDDESTGQRIKRHKKNRIAVVAASSSTTDPNSATNTASVTSDLNATVFAADRSVAITDVNDATKQRDWFDEPSLATAAISKNASSNKYTAQSSTPAASTSLNSTYKGPANQTRFIEKNPNAPNRTYGPMKAATNIRTITVTDYAPDVCKDYKQTGFCGFGDNCKFLHSREQVMQGWQLDREWENVGKGKKNMAGTVVANVAERTAESVNRGTADIDAAEAALLEKIPFKCIICKEDYKAPIATRCGHYFCEGCALKRYRKDPTCAACGVGTNGVFNGAKKLSRLLEKKAAREEEIKKKAESENEAAVP
ncbi:Pre-mRNA-splicing factor cwc24 [Ceratocystis fimbriata CBS 114723]|uniref:Pre-mRNA-splicing factor CWC24 n=1 Tax=Ceratocystis fimbriata CBS 114723 TaxID=1035309 RepID=A0A2C5WVB6_9PEZI|nr:Pre-mRNA-splicing factor cwc24 [Ceratocystis fimbriata CBS 114723]